MFALMGAAPACPGVVALGCYVWGGPAHAAVTSLSVALSVPLFAASLAYAGLCVLRLLRNGHRAEAILDGVVYVASLLAVIAGLSLAILGWL